MYNELFALAAISLKGDVMWILNVLTNKGQGKREWKCYNRFIFFEVYSNPWNIKTCVNKNPNGKATNIKEKWTSLNSPQSVKDLIFILKNNSERTYKRILIIVVAKCVKCQTTVDLNLLITCFHMKVRSGHLSVLTVFRVIWCEKYMKLKTSYFKHFLWTKQWWYT